LEAEMSPESLIYPALICYAIIVVAVILEHALFKHWHELLRRGIGASTVLVATLIPTLLGYLEFWTWLFVALAFVVAGATLSAMVVKEETDQNRKRLTRTVDALVDEDHVR
jgi:predicted tellurium resistance membrane protein TerC